MKFINIAVNFSTITSCASRRLVQTYSLSRNGWRIFSQAIDPAIRYFKKIPVISAALDAMVLGKGPELVKLEVLYNIFNFKRQKKMTALKTNCEEQLEQLLLGTYLKLMKREYCFLW